MSLPWFQSLVRVDWLWNEQADEPIDTLAEFQSLVRVDWLWNVRFRSRSPRRTSCFNPSCGLIGCGT